MQTSSVFRVDSRVVAGEEVPDLPSVPWVESPFFHDLLRGQNLSAEEAALARSFAEDGMCIFDTGMTAQAINLLLSSLEGKYVRGAHSYDTRVMDIWRENPHVRSLAAHERVMDVLRLLYRREPLPFQTLNFRLGTEQRAHSDAVHFSAIPRRFMAAVWVALEDVDAENGPLFVYPGSHKLPFYDLQDLGVSIQDGGYQQYERFLPSLMAAYGLERKELHVRRGQAVLWSANLVHGGCPIGDASRTRYSQATHYFFADCVYYAPMASDLVGGKIAFKDVTNIANGEKVSHVYGGRVIR